MYEKLLNLRRTHDRHLVGCPLCQYAVLIFGVGAALDTSLHGEPLTGVHIRRLREKLEENPAEPDHILTKWGVGYYFTDKD